MINLIKQLIFAFQYRRAVRKADRLHSSTNRKYMVLAIGKRLRVLSKQEVRRYVAGGFFLRGVTARDIERRALYTTL